MLKNICSLRTNFNFSFFSKSHHMNFYKFEITLTYCMFKQYIVQNRPVLFLYRLNRWTRKELRWLLKFRSVINSIQIFLWTFDSSSLRDGDLKNDVHSFRFVFFWKQFFPTIYSRFRFEQRARSNMDSWIRVKSFGQRKKSFNHPGWHYPECSLIIHSLAKRHAGRTLRIDRFKFAGGLNLVGFKRCTYVS